MIYLHIITDYSEFFIPKPFISVNDATLRITSQESREEFKIRIKSVKKIELITKPEVLQQLLAEIVNNKD